MFQSFWGLFETLIDSVQSAEAQKFGYLMTKLKGEPYDLLKDFPLTPENYDAAKSLLKSRYGDPIAIARGVRSKLFGLQTCRSETEVFF